MLRQLLLGGAVSLANIAIHALVMTTVVRVAQVASARKHENPSLFLIAVMIPAVSVLMAAHVIEVMVWSLAYWIVHAQPEGASVVYLGFASFATLGYGDVVPVQRWQLLGPISAMNGALLFGWSTAVMFEVMRRAMARGGASE